MSSRPFVVLVSLVFVISVIFVIACGSDENGGETDPNANENQSNQQNNGQDWDPEFAEIAEIVQQTCAIGGCHGEPTNDATTLSFGGNVAEVSLGQIQAVFETHESSEGVPLVDPGNAEGSSLYFSLISDDPDVFMPQGLDPLPDAQIDLVESWIDAGANYEQ